MLPKQVFIPYKNTILCYKTQASMQIKLTFVKVKLLY